jgi:hypothetical protein
MRAIEFETQTHDGIVQIPPQYEAWQNKTVRVILLDSEESPISETPRFNAVALKTQGYRFDRELAHER